MMQIFSTGDADTDLAEARNQAFLRIGICAFMGTYFAFTGFWRHPLYLAFVGFSVAALVATALLKQLSRTAILLLLALDNFFTIAGLAVTGAKGTFLLIFLIHISFGYGVRFGAKYLVTSLVVAASGIVFLVSTPTPWKSNLHFALAFLFGMPFISIYVYYLAKRIRASKLTLIQKGEENRKLMAFVAHDIRASLHALLATTMSARESTGEPQTRRRLQSMEDAISILAGMVSSVVGPSAYPAKAPYAGTNPTNTASWFMATIRIFQDDIHSIGARLQREIDTQLPKTIDFDRLTAERVIFNVMSNAIRFSRGGLIKIALTKSLAETAGSYLQICVTNNSDPNYHAEHSIQMETGANPGIPANLHGAALGLKIAESLAASAGGTFAFRRLDAVTHESRLVLPFAPAEARYWPALAGPLIAATTDKALWSRISACLDDHCSVIQLSTLDVLHNHLPQDIDKCVGIIIDEESMAQPGATCASIMTWLPIVPVAFVARSQEDTLVTEDRVNEFHISAALTPAEWASAGAVMAAVHFAAQPHDIEFLAGQSSFLLGKSILILDDNQLNCLLLQEQLSNAGMDLEFTHSIEAARNALRGGIYDGVIFDWNIGAQSVRELVNEIRELPRGSNMAIVILSADESEEIGASVAPAVRPAILQKPLKKAALIAGLMDQLAIMRPVRAGAGSRHEDTILDLSIYRGLLETGTTSKWIIAALNQFLNDCERLQTQFTEVVRNGHLDESFKTAHSLKSLCDSVGALSIGSFYANVAPVLRNRRAVAADQEVILEAHRTLWRITRLHVETYRLSLSALA